MSLGARIRLGIVGAGWAGTRIGEAVAELDGSVTIGAIVDPDEAQRVSVGDALGVDRTFATMREALDTDIDAVVIASPHRLHAVQAVEAATAGIHVLVEKPMAVDLVEADRMIEAATRAGVVLGVAENEAYEPWVARLHDMVRSREPFGQLAFAIVTAGHRSPDSRYPGRRSWLTEPAVGGTGSWVLHGVHTVATCRRILGGVRTIFVREHRTESYRRDELEATMSALLTLDDGTPVTVVQTPEVDLGMERKTIALYGDAGVLRADRAGWTLERASVRPIVIERGDWPSDPRSSYARELEAFVDEIRGGAPMPTSGRSERETLAVILAGLESMRTGQPIELHPRHDPGDLVGA